MNSVEWGSEGDFVAKPGDERKSEETPNEGLIESSDNDRADTERPEFP